MTVTFCGHRRCPDSSELRAWLSGCIEELITEGADTFYLGGYGDYDRIAASVVRFRTIVPLRSCSKKFRFNSEKMEHSPLPIR